MRALILAAGRGERLRPLTDHTPKPLLAAGGKPLIEHTLLAMVTAGFREFVVNLAHLGEQIQDYLGDGSRYGASIVYSPEGDAALETGGGIFRAMPLLEGGPFAVVNGDLATDFPYSRLLAQPKGLAHLVLVPNPPHHPKGDFCIEPTGLLSATAEPRNTFSGIGVYRPELFAGCQPGKFPLAPILRSAMSAGQVTGELYSGFWMDIGTVERLQEFDERLRNDGA